MAAVEDHVELLGFLHLLQQRLGVLGVPRQLSDLKAEVVARGSLDQLLQANETCGEGGGSDAVHVKYQPKGVCRSTESIGTIGGDSNIYSCSQVD